MRINETFSVLNKTLSTAIRRQYPLVYTEKLTTSFDNLTLPKNLENSLAKIPYVEALPQYKNQPKGDYGSGVEALLDPSLLGDEYRHLVELMMKFKPSGVFFDPYVHQVQALKAWAKGSDIIVSTGTGSGKTECFLWPIVGHLHQYARRNRDNPKPHRGIKALILYPMNALVADQLKRLRQILGGEELATELAQSALFQGNQERPFQFGQYTGRTKFHGAYAKAGAGGGSVSAKVKKAANQFENFNKIRNHDSTGPETEGALYSQMMDKGLIPAKGEDEEGPNESLFWDMSSFGSHAGAENKPNAKLITEPGDRELYFRHEMHNTGYANLTMKQGDVRVPRITDETNGGGTPDVLVTNYSMLEYMLKRPLEHGMFHETKEWLTEHPENKLMLVLDEAHLYQGALGTEVGLLVRRLLSSLGILGSEFRNKVQFILTSASLGDDHESKQQFVHGLTGRPLERTGQWAYKDTSEVDWNTELGTTSVYIKGEKWQPGEGDCTESDLAEIREELSSLEYENKSDEYLLEYFLKKTETPDTSSELTEWLRGHALFRRLYMSLLGSALSLDELGQRLFATNISDIEEMKQTRIATEAVLNLVAALRGPRPDSERTLPLLGIRAHLLYRGLPRLYWDLKNTQILLREQNSLDVAYPVRGCRQCGAPHASIWISQENWTQVVATIENGGAYTARAFSRPIDFSIRLEVYLYDDYSTDENGYGFGHMKIDGRPTKADGPAHIWVNTEDNKIQVNSQQPGGNWLPGYLAAERRDSPAESVQIIQEAIRDADDNTGRSNVQEITFSKATCLQCNTLHKNRHTDQITDYMTKGDDAFSQLMKELIAHQTPDPAKTHLPNKGKKVMVFSDSRSRASKLALKIQDNSNYDELRLLLLHLLNQDWFKALPDQMKTLNHLYSTFVLNCIRAKLEPFSGTGDKYRNPRNSFARTRVDVIAAHAALLYENIGHEIFETRQELRNVIAAANGGIDNEDKAINFYDDFCARAPKSSDEFAAAAERNRRNGHRAYVKLIRRNLMSTITRAVQNSSTNAAFTSKEKHVILGVCFDPDFYPDGEINFVNGHYEAMRVRLATMGITFTDETIENNSITRFEEICRPGNVNNNALKAPRVDATKHTGLMRDIKKVCKARIQKIRDFQANERSAQFQNCKIYINTMNYTLDNLSEITNQLMYTFSELWPDTPKGRRNFRTHWNHVLNLANLENSTPWEFSSAIMDFIGSKDFSLSSLGLGYVKMSPHVKAALRTRHTGGEDDDQLRQQFDTHWDECLDFVLCELVHWMTRPSLGKDPDDGKEKDGGQRCVLSEGGAYDYQPMKHHSSVYTREEDWGISPNSVELKYLDLIRRMDSELVVEFEYVRAELLRTNSHADAGGKLLVSAEIIQLQHILTEGAGLLGCRRCGITMPVIHEDTSPAKCINCNYEILVDYDAQIPIFNQRIESPWRNPAKKAINSSYQDLGITVIRAEEHTAQINTTKDEEEMYTSAEEFELLFQDVPFAVPEEDDAWTYVQSPVDILSCTTTMEVGIDIGSLTCVALRTIPRKASNYQQRVGRAGRGSAEVCVAVSWCDNQPHAQNYFDNPQEMLTHPQDSPVIYLNNHAIIERHINAAIFQAFFKRMVYDLSTRKFEGMGAPEHEANLMESMGTLEGFFSEDDANEFSYTKFRDWLDGESPSENQHPEMTWSTVSPQIEAILPEQTDIELHTLVENLREFLHRMQETLEQDGEAVE